MDKGSPIWRILNFSMSTRNSAKLERQPSCSLLLARPRPEPALICPCTWLYLQGPNLVASGVAIRPCHPIPSHPIHPIYPPIHPPIHPSLLRLRLHDFTFAFSSCFCLDPISCCSPWLLSSSLLQSRERNQQICCGSEADGPVASRTWPADLATATELDPAPARSYEIPLCHPSRARPVPFLESRAVSGSSWVRLWVPR